jgi:FkbM family methyltransferase
MLHKQSEFGRLPPSHAPSFFGHLEQTTKALARGSLKHVLPAPLFWRFLAWRTGFFDPELQLIHHMCDRAKVSIDVGASIGGYTVHMLNASSKCYAFEPRPDSAAYLEGRLVARANPRLRVETVALSDHAGEAKLRILMDDTGRSSIEAENQVEQLGTVRVLTVPMRRLDDYDAMEPVGCIKIDVEGHEEAVLRGARGILLRDHPSLLVEIEERHKRHSVSTVNLFLRELGYSGFFFRGNRLHPIELFRAEEHQDVANIAGNINKDNRYINNFLFFAGASLAKVRHLIAGN